MAIRKIYLRGTTDMAIREFSPDGTPRAKIAFVGEVPPEEHLSRFREHKFTWEPSDPDYPVTLGQLRDPDFIAKLDAVIWTQDAIKPKNPNEKDS